MAILNNLFNSTESTANEVELDEIALAKYWKHYCNTVTIKREIINNLIQDTDFLGKVHELANLLDSEFIDISTQEKEGLELISNLELIEHDKKIRRIHKLEQCLDYAKTRYEYTHKLLLELYSVLKFQKQLISTLERESRNVDKFLLHLRSQLELELEILKKISNMENFHELFLALIKGEHVIHNMDATEKLLLSKMQKGIHKIFSNEINDGIVYEWAMTVFDAIEAKIHQGVADNMFSGYHSDIDFEFVNRLEFIILVKDTIFSLKKRKVSDPMINVFVYLFREWYNHERD